MVAVGSTNPYAAYSGYASTHAAGYRTAQSAATAPNPSAQDKATEVVLSDEAKAAMSEKSFAAVVEEARAKLTALLTEAGRTTPLEGKRLALDLATLDARELYAIASDEAFSGDERQAAGLEMQRRLDAALAGPAAIAEVTGNYTGLYKAAATYLDSLGPEEKASADWQAGRDAVTEGLKRLKADPKTLPDAGDADPVALYLVLKAKPTVPESEQDLSSLAGNARTQLDTLYAKALASGRVPTFNRHTTVGTFIDLSALSSQTLSAIVLDGQSRFSAEEVRVAKDALHRKSGETLLASFSHAAKSGDPTAFSQNVISAFASLSPAERQAAGWSDRLYQAALESYTATDKLMQMFSEASSGATGLTGLLGR